MRAAALWLLLPSLAAAGLRKCCEMGESLFASPEDGYLCLPAPEHVWSYGEISYGPLEKGCKLEYADLGREVSCIDNLAGSDRIVALVCPGNDTFPVPEVAYLAKCCPANRTYDSRLQFCWSMDQPDSWPTAFLNVLMYGARGVIDIRTGSPDCGPDQVVVDHLVLSKNVRRLQTASIAFKVDDREYVLNPEEMCVDRTERRDIFVIRACEDENIACEKHTCIRKCCSDGKSFYDNSNCSYPNHESFIRPMKIVNMTDSGLHHVEHRTPAYWYGGMNCLKYIDGLRQDYIQTTSGDLYNSKEDVWTEKGAFCVEHAHAGGTFDEFVFICFPDDEPEPDIPVWATVAMIVSSIFLLLTFLVYAALPSLKNLHGKTLMCHVFCLLTAYVSLATVRLITDYLLHILCLVLGYVTIFSFLASFFWLNVISFDIWWTFGSMRPVMDRKRREWRRFIIYSLYAWALPSLITASVIVAQDSPWFPEYFKPRIGESACWFERETKASLLFFVGPAGIVMVVNLVFFILTVRHCSKVRSDLDKVGHTPISDKKFKSDKSKLAMNTKLFIAMGINWGLEFCSAIFLPLAIFPNWIWYLSDMYNACQGLVIFYIFVMKKRVLRELKLRLEGLLMRGRPLPRQPSVSTLFTANNINSCPEVAASHHLIKKCSSESRLSPLPALRKNHRPLAGKSQSSNRLLI